MRIKRDDLFVRCPEGVKQILDFSLDHIVEEFFFRAVIGIERSSVITGLVDDIRDRNVMERFLRH
ncbi:hypothetical protein D3C76_1115730 [compost metagenome]